MIEIRVSREASPRLVRPFKAVVGVANARLVDGGEARAGSVFLRHDVGRRLYVVSASESAVRLTDSAGQEVLGGRLSINGIQLDESGNPTRSLFPVDLPRNPDSVTIPNLFDLRDSIVTSVELLAEELQEAAQVPAEEYYRAIDAMARGCN